MDVMVGDRTLAPGASSDPGLVCDPQATWVIRLVCDPSGTATRWSSGVAVWWGSWLSVWWPLLPGLAVVAAALVGVVVQARRRAGRHAIRRGVWLGISPPAVLPPDAAAGLWRAVAAMLYERRQGWLRRWMAPARVAAEFVATEQGVQVGMWVPPTVAVGQVADAVRQVWPGARVTPHTPGLAWAARRVRAIELFPPGGPWTPLIDPATARSARPIGEAGGVGEDPLRWVLSALGRTHTQPRPGEWVCVQVVVTAHPHSTAHWAGQRRRPWWARLLAGSVQLAVRAVLEIVDVLLGSSPATSTRSSTGSAAEADPVRAAARRAQDLKRATGPHLSTTIRVAIATPTPHLRPDRGRGVVGDDPEGRERWRRAGEIADGFRLVTSTSVLRRRHVRRARRRVTARLPGRSFAATVAELAAVWHVPSEPTRYGVADQPARNRPTTPGLARWHTHTDRPTRPPAYRRPDRGRDRPDRGPTPGMAGGVEAGER